MTIKAQSPITPAIAASPMKTLSPTPAAGLLPKTMNGGSSAALVNGCAAAAATPAPKERHIWLVTGPAGSGKSTLASYLADFLHLPYVEGDHYHPQANIEKMSHGQPLTDADRWDWLTALREESLRRLAAHPGAPGVVVTCSALKRKYRDVLRVAPYYLEGLRVHFIYLRAPEDVLLQRVANRQGHYMGADMVHSQVSILELPAPDETDVVTLDVCRPAEVVRQDALERVLGSMV